MQVLTDVPDNGLVRLFDASDEEDLEEEGIEENSGEGERDSSVLEELRKIVREKASIPQTQRYLRRCVYFLCCAFLPVKMLAPAEPVVMAGEAAETIIACTFRRRILQWGNEISEDCDARLDAVLAKLPTGERDRIRWNLRCAGLIDEPA
ncbi:MAG: hypothetical protein AAB853_02100 [Patescibacteria group bacterium]